MNGIEVIEYKGEGYRPMIEFNGWRVAFLRYARRFDPEFIQRLECHKETDEVFVLLNGKGLLIIGEEQELCPLEQGKLYNVKRSVWHAVCVNREAQILIVENADTSMENTEYLKTALRQETIRAVCRQLEQ